MKRIILEYIPLFGSLNRVNEKSILLFGSSSENEWNE